MMLATTSNTFIIGQIATVLGWVMDGIYRVLNAIGIPNLGLCIIIFSILVYVLMTPLQVKQQKFSKLSSVMQPELQKVQKKYKDKKDQESQQRMQQETMAVYEKYGVSPTGSCLQLVIQMPILFALYQVIYKIPGYVSGIAAIFTDAMDKIMSVNGFTDILQKFITDNNIVRVRLMVDEAGVASRESIIDFLYALSPAQWKDFASTAEFSGFADVLNRTAADISSKQSFGPLNIADQPMTYITAMFAGGAIIAGICAILVPFLAWLTQVLNVKLMPQPASNDDGKGGAADSVSSSMKTMNTVMPLMSAFFCLSFPVGLGIYWIASAVVRSVQQVVINKQMDKLDLDKIIEENTKKMEAKRAKAGLPPQKITNQANQTTRNINTKVTKGISNTDADTKAKKVEEAYKKASGAKPGSIAAKANLVRDYNERNKK